MKKIDLNNITLIGADCVDVTRLERVAMICESFARFGAVKILSSQEGKRYPVKKIRHLGSIGEYSRFMIRELYPHVKTEFALVIQHDGFILNPEAWTEEFLHFDYIGAPWWYSDGRNVGNGGFSLRSRKLLKILATDPHIRKFSPEDHHICRTYRKYLESKGIKFAPEYLAARFSVEGNRHQFRTGQNIWIGQFGFHDLKKTVLTAWLKKHPEFDFIDNTLKEPYCLPERKAEKSRM